MATSHPTRPPRSTPRARRSPCRSRSPRKEVDALLRQPAQADTPEAIRDTAMLELMYATGMRVTELVSVNVESVHLEPRPGWVRCIGKGEKERTIPVYERALEAVERYLDEGRPKLLKNRPQLAMFVNRRGERLTRQGFWLILKGYARKASIEAHVTPPHAAPTPSPPTCCAAAPPCATCRSCSATPTSPPRRSTPSSRTATCARSTSRSTPAPAERASRGTA